MQDFNVDSPQIMDFHYGDNIATTLLHEEVHQEKCAPGEDCEHFTCTRHSSPFLVTMLYLSTVRIMKVLARKPPGADGGEEEVGLYDAAGKMKRLLTKMSSRWMLASEFPNPRGARMRSEGPWLISDGRYVFRAVGSERGSLVSLIGFAIDLIFCARRVP